jgi:hypothetical protein
MLAYRGRPVSQVAALQGTVPCRPDLTSSQSDNCFSSASAPFLIPTCAAVSDPNVAVTLYGRGYRSDT